MKKFRRIRITLCCALTMVIVMFTSRELASQDGPTMQWTPGTIHAANKLFERRSGWSFALPFSVQGLVARLRAMLGFEQTMDYYNEKGQLVVSTQVAFQEDTQGQPSTRIGSIFYSGDRMIGYEEVGSGNGTDYTFIRSNMNYDGYGGHQL